MRDSILPLLMQDRLNSYFSFVAPGLDFHTHFTSDELFRIDRILSRAEEQEISHRDQWGNWEYPFTLEEYQRPYLDDLVCKKLKSIPYSGSSIWPEGKKFAFWLTHDLDLVSEGDPHLLIRKQRKNFIHAENIFSKLTFAAQMGYNYMRSMKSYNNDPLWCFERWLDIEQEYNFNSTFFVFTPPTDPAAHHLVDCDFTWTDKMKYRGQKILVGDFINQLSEEGVEIGCHGSYRTFNDAKLLGQQREKLVSHTGKSILSSRQHYLHFDITVTPSVLEAAGFSLDSTLGFNRTIGYRAGTAFPFLLSSCVLEMPQIIMDGALFNPNSLEYNEKLACDAVIRIIDQVEANGACLTVNFHPNYLQLPEWWNTYKFLLKELSTRKAACMNAASILDVFKKVSAGLNNSK